MSTPEVTLNELVPPLPAAQIDDIAATALHQVPPLEQHTEHPHITRVEGVALLRGTRLAVRLIAQQYRAGDSVDDILHTYPHLSATAVHDAIQLLS